MKDKRVVDSNTDEQRRTEDNKLKKEEESRRKREEYKEISERQSKQRDAAEEGNYLLIH